MTWVAVGAAAVSVAGGVAANNSQKEQAENAIGAQRSQIAGSEDFIKRQGSRSRRDALPLFDAAEQSTNLGFQGALDIFNQSMPQQFDTFQQGNLGAQQALLSGQQQQQNAILGLPASLSGMQPQAISFNTDFTQQQLPEFISSQQALTDFAPQGVNMQIAEAQEALNRAVALGGKDNRARATALRSEIAGLETQRGGFNPADELPILSGRIQDLQSRIDAATTAGGKRNRRLVAALTPELSDLQSRLGGLGLGGSSQGSSMQNANIRNLLGGLNRGN